MKIAMVLLLLPALLYLFRQANIKRGKLRAQARQQYHEVMVSINSWAECKDDPVRFQLAQVALALYDDLHKRSTVLQVTMRNTPPEDYEVLTEWRKLIHDSEVKARSAWSGRLSELLAMRYAENRVELREYCRTVEAGI